MDSQYYNSNQSRSKGRLTSNFKQKISKKKIFLARRPSLERQNTLYDDSTYYGDSIYYPNDNITQVNCVEIR